MTDNCCHNHEEAKIEPCPKCAEGVCFCSVKVGDRLWNTRLGWGEVTAADSLLYPIEVTFDSGKTSTFTERGGAFDESAQELFYAPVTITPPPRPKRMVEKSKVVWVLPEDMDSFCAGGELYWHPRRGAEQSRRTKVTVTWQEEE